MLWAGDVMRLICPNCGAQYEVDDAVIPQSGRDVQCSNCGHTWFQVAAGHETPEAETEEALTQKQPAQAPAPPPPPVTEEPEAEPEREPEPEVAEPLHEAQEALVQDEEASDEPEDEDEPEVQPTDEEEHKPADAPSRQSLDDAVLDVLREEAEREQLARQVEAAGGTLESQPDLGLEPPPAGPARSGLQERMARLRGVASEPERQVSTASTGSRRDLLPDIEEINSTLRATSERQASGDTSGYIDEDDDEFAEKRGGFNVSFSAILMIAALIVGLYILAPKISEALPAAEPAMTAYVAMIDAARSALDRGMTALIEKATMMISGTGQG